MLKSSVFCALFVFLAANLHAGADYKPDANAPRSQVPAAYKWHPSDIFKSDGAWDAAYKKAQQNIREMLAEKNIISSPETLRHFMMKYEATSKQIGDLSLYAGLKVSEDENINKYQIMSQRSVKLVMEFQPITILESVVRLPDAEAHELFAAKELAPYKAYFEELRRRKDRVLPREAERVLGIMEENLFIEADLNDLPSDIEQIFKATTRDIQLPKIKDENGRDVQLALSNYPKYRSSKDRAVRKEAVEAFFGSLKKYQNIFAAALGGEARRSVQFARTRNYKTSLEAYLNRNNVDPKVVTSLIKTIRENIKPLHRYVELRKKVLGIKDLHIYDLYTPLVPSVDTDIPYDKGIADVEAALKPLGDKYVALARKAMEPGSGWTDVYPNKGKRSGAFCTSTWGVHPYMELNYMNSIDDVSTLAHELGHAMHSALNMEAQPFMSFGYDTLLAEIASTFNENLLSEYLLNKYRDDKVMRLYLLGERLESIRTTIYRQLMFQEFERKVHEFAEAGIPVTAELLNKTYKDLVRFYYGPNFVIGGNDDIEWAYIPHMYYKYYVFNYAGGLASAIALSNDVMKNGEEGRERYLAMLTAPATEPPIETLRKAGVDLTKPDAIKAAADLMNKTMDEIEKLIGKKK